jgi:prolyl-tRNA synthetase
MRGREFLMKDAYSFDVSEEAALASYESMRATYCRIFDRLGLTYRLVEADPGAIGGSKSAEFQVLADSGEDAIVACDTCDYAANVEIATVKAPPAAVRPRQTSLNSKESFNLPWKRSLGYILFRSLCLLASRKKADERASISGIIGRSILSSNPSIFT